MGCKGASAVGASAFFVIAEGKESEEFKLAVALET